MSHPRRALPSLAAAALLVTLAPSPGLGVLPAAPPQAGGAEHAVPLGSPQSCAVPGDTLRIDLASFWARAQAEDPFLRRYLELATAENEAGSAVRREWIPSGGLQGAGDYGQRLSPGEERVLGVGARGELRLLSQWRILDGDRGARAATADRRHLSVEAEGDVFRADLLAELASLYTEAVAARERTDLRQQHLARLDEIGQLVEARIQAGFESRWEEALLAESRLRARRLLQEALMTLEAAETEMALRTGVCPTTIPPGIRTAPPDTEMGASPGGVSVARDAPMGPDIRLGLSRTQEFEALAREEASRDRWSLDLVGILGPTRSRAFDDREFRTEYLVGMTLSWRPDLTGIRSRLAEAERARARAERAWTDGVRAEVERELTRLELAADRLRQTSRLLEAEREAAEVRLTGAVDRWVEGVDRWLDVVQAAERLTELEGDALAHRVEMAELTIRRHRLLGTLESLPGLLFSPSSTRDR